MLGRREIVQATAGLLLERDRLGCMGVSAAVLLTTSDFDAERVLRPRVGFGSASAEARAVDIGGAVLSVLSLATKAKFLCERRPPLRITGGGDLPNIRNCTWAVEQIR